MVIINIGDEGLDVRDEEKGLAVHVNSDLSFVVTCSLDDSIVADGSDVRDMIDGAEIIKAVLIEKYGGYR